MMAPTPLLLLLLAVALLAALGAQEAHAAASKVTTNNKKVQVQVMYESLCPDSIRFIKDQLTPTYEALGSQRMVVEFVPYGKAATYPTDSGYLFRCQHGSSECRGNKIMACGLARLLGDNKKQVKFVNCVMSQTNPSRLNDKCVAEAGLESGEIMECVNGREGQVLLAGMGERTPSNIDFVPRVVFNGVSTTHARIQAKGQLHGSSVAA
ncbi:GILT-like protein 1 [Frankliniella fusca]|uniref:GILT-like protein 1 n=1 Tax=Frankliniella fusca TaxID=407009 RepID=A0AAE1HXA8_9NEOP|nr:GILT-like protein 1 [Frankliniella fusca]